MSLPTYRYAAQCSKCLGDIVLISPDEWSAIRTDLMCPDCSRDDNAEPQHARFVARNQSMHSRIVHLEKMAENADDDIQELERRCKNLHATDTLQQGQYNEHSDAISNLSESLDCFKILVEDYREGGVLNLRAETRRLEERLVRLEKHHHMT